MDAQPVSKQAKWSTRKKVVVAVLGVVVLVALAGAAFVSVIAAGLRF
jgi:hypothetical protein